MCLSEMQTLNKNEWFGWEWTVKNEDDLANLVAIVATGQYLAAEKIINKSSGNFNPKSGFAGAKKKLTKYKVRDKKRFNKVYSRDGWVFQVIAWIAAHKTNCGGLIFPPHSRESDKGFDGLIIEFFGKGDENCDEIGGMSNNITDIARIVICEEKATKHPRKLVQNSVWPEFSNYETGNRDDELNSAVSTLLDKYSGSINVEDIVNEIIWKKKRAYRVSVTIDGSKANTIERNRIFEGYQRVVTDVVTRRRADTFLFDNFRSNLSRIAKKAKSIIESWERGNNV